MKPVEVVYEGKYAIEIHFDEDASDPCKEYDNFGKMVCFHSKYTLGHEQPKSLGKWLSSKLHQEGLSRTTDAYYDYESDLEYDSTDAIKEAWKMLEGYIVSLPLYLYDHSGLRISTGPISCPWDSGQVGFVYADKKKILAEFGGKNLTKGNIDKAVKLMEAEVDTYDKYLSGSVYGYIVKGLAGFPQYCEENDYDADDQSAMDDYLKDEAPEIDSCWGYYGYDKQSGLMESALDAIKCAKGK